MAQQATPEVAAGVSKRRFDQQQPTETATVITGQAATPDVPETVGAFEQLPVPNASTTRWERVYRPAEANGYPYATVEYSISREEGDVQVVRSVQLYTASAGAPQAIRKEAGRRGLYEGSSRKHNRRARVRGDRRRSRVHDRNYGSRERGREPAARTLTSAA